MAGGREPYLKTSAAGVLGEPTPLEIESQVGNFRQTAIAHLPMAVPFALQQFSAFCDAAIEQVKR
jgi:hypothetical protein